MIRLIRSIKLNSLLRDGSFFLLSLASVSPQKNVDARSNTRKTTLLRSHNS